MFQLIMLVAAVVWLPLVAAVGSATAGDLPPPMPCKPTPGERAALPACDAACTIK
jgi:hypothetical protein